MLCVRSVLRARRVGGIVFEYMGKFQCEVYGFEEV